jgi:triosephosphate isomerase (TIM)
MRKKIAAGNWKMHTTIEEGVSLATALCQADTASSDRVILCVPFTHLAAVAKALDRQAHIALAAQNLSSQAQGAYTGEVSASMLVSAKVEFVLVGHSERRTLFNEDSAMLRGKIAQALSVGIKVIYCLGEPLEIRQAEAHEAFVLDQLQNDLFHLSEADLANVVIAYEPIWAIGTGLTASPQQAQDMHAFIRASLANQYNQALANDMSILYGGSVKAGNAREIFSQPDVDGGLVGGAALVAEDFAAICASF